jgi:uncharacterized membrane protein
MSFAAIVFAGWSWLTPLIVVFVAIVAALAWSGRGSGVPLWVRISSGILRAAGVLALVLCLLEPLWVAERARPGANIFAIVADNSQSMQKIKDAGEPESRGDLLRKTLVDGVKTWQATLEQHFQVRRYLFDSRLESTPNFKDLNFSGRSTALGITLQTIREHWRNQPVAGVLLFTDGNATDIPGDAPALEGCPPIYPVVSGRDLGLQDISIQKVSVSQTAFEDAPVTVNAAVGAQGFAGSEIMAQLTEVATGPAPNAFAGPTQAVFRITGVSNVVARWTQRAADTDATVNFRFQVQPREAGIHVYDLETRARDEWNQPSTRESTLVNNRRLLVVDRGQEPLRVLYVGGRPNWEYKFLNRAIQEDHQVRMVSIIRVARREPKFEFKGRPGESSNPLFRGFDHQDEDAARYDQPVLVRLNTEDAMELRGGFPKTARELFGYHAVILDHVEAEFFTREQMMLLQRFVSERGGGFIMLGGAESFREGDYAGTSIGSLLPVYLDRPVEANLPGQWKLSFTREGWLQPWIRLRSTEAEEKTRLESVPAFQVLNAVSDIKPGASVLATVSDPEGETHPALVVQRFGLGRSAALMVGDYWRWGLKDEAMQQDLAKSWRQLVRWLVADVPPRFKIEPQVGVGGNLAEVRLVVKARDEEFKPMDNATVQLSIMPMRRGSGVSTNAGIVQMNADASGSEPGVYEASYLAREPGAYWVTAMVSGPDAKPAGQAAAAWVSDPEQEELRSLKPNRALLETIARRTGGEIIAAEDLGKFARRLPERHAPISETWNYPFWHQPIVFAFVLACFVTEWGMRRWKGLP